MSFPTSILLAGVLSATVIFSGCSKKESASGEKSAAAEQSQPAAQEAGAKAAGAGQAGAEQAKTPPAPPPPRTFTVAAGTPLPVRTITALSTKTAKTGAKFQGTLAEDLVVDGYVVARKGAIASGEVASSDPGGRVKGVASIAVVLKTIETIDAGPVSVTTGQFTQDAKSTKGKDAAKVGVATGVGAAIGAIAGGGKGAAIGAGVGAAGGTGLVMSTRGAPAQIPAESLVTFRLSAPFTVTEKR